MALAAELRAARSDRLPGYALFAGLLAMAGLPIYIHAPKFYVDEYGVSLAALGSVLFVLRLIDVVQDPLLGRLAEATRASAGLRWGWPRG
jgi:glycoside/pentoside/hexuronide:cation symporter, GPH family